MQAHDFHERGCGVCPLDAYGAVVDIAELPDEG